MNKHLLWLGPLAIVILTMFRAPAFAQSSAPVDSLRSYSFVCVSGFLPLREAYRINYSTNTVGLPIELSAGIGFPTSSKVSVPLVLRYIQREANFIANTSLAAWSLEPGVRVQLEQPGADELSFFTGASLLLTRSTVQSEIERTSDGTSPSLQQVEKDYYNMGLGLDLGLNYPVTRGSALDLLLHIAILMGNPASHGGLGNTGGVSIGLAYKIYF